MTHSWKSWRYAARFAAAAAILGISLQPVGQSFAKPISAGYSIRVTPTVVNVRNLPKAADANTGYTALPFLSSPNLAAEKAAAASLPPGPGIQHIAPATAGSEQPSNVGGFQAVNFTDTTCGCLPPDGGVAVGPSDIMAAANTAFKIFNKSGTLISGPTEMSTFFGTACKISLYSDPFLDYDNASGHFVFSAVTYSGSLTSSDLCVAASQTTDPTGKWNIYKFTMPTTGEFYDFPKIAVGSDAIYSTGNNFANGSVYKGVQLFAIKKSDVYAGLATTPKTQTVSASFDTLIPARTLGIAPQTQIEPGLFVAFDDFASCPSKCSNAYLWTWQQPFGSNVFKLASTLPVTPYSLPVSALSSNGTGGTISVNTDDARNLSTWFNGADKSMWAAHTIACNPGTGTVDCIQWIQIGTSGGVHLAQQGIVSSNGDYRYYPFLSLDKNSDVTLTYSFSNASSFIGINYTGRTPSDPSNTMEAEAVLEAGQAANPNASSRWGDYGEAGVDANGCDTYNLLEYSPSNAASNIWSTWVGHTKWATCS